MHALFTILTTATAGVIIVHILIALEESTNETFFILNGQVNRVNFQYLLGLGLFSMVLN